MIEAVERALAEAKAALSQLIADRVGLQNIVAASELMVHAFQQGRKVMSCGNGGSMCDAMHFAEELSGKFRPERKALPALAISDAAHLTCAGNDFGFDTVFSRFVEAHGQKGDVLLAISTSGKSPNIIRAAEEAKKQGVKVIALTGKKASKLGELADIELCTPGLTPFSDRTQELHIKVIHILIELVEQALFAPKGGV